MRPSPASGPSPAAVIAPCRSQPMMSRTPACEQRSAPRRRPAAPTPVITTRTSSIALADHLQRVQQRRQHDDRRAVLVVVEDRDVERLAQAPLDLEAARRGDVLEVDAAEDRRDRLDRADDLVGSFVARQIGNASTPPNSLKRSALPSITGSAASGPMSPSPSTAVPSLTTATVLGLIVRFQTLAGSSAIARRDAADAGRVGHREVVAGLQRHPRDDLDLAAEVHEEGAVGDVLDLDPVDRVHGGDDAVEVVLRRQREP